MLTGYKGYKGYKSYKGYKGLRGILDLKLEGAADDDASGIGLDVGAIWLKEHADEHNCGLPHQNDNLPVVVPARAHA